MKILIYCLNFAPELVGCGKYNSELALELHKRGHDVRVITSPPYYPHWQINSDYSGRKYKKEIWHGIQIIRCPLYIPQKVTGLKRMLHLASFATTSILPVLSMYKWKPHLVFCVAPTLFTSLTAIFFARMIKAKSWLHIQDFEVDAAFKLGILKGNFIANFAKRCEKTLYQLYDKISTISEKMMDNLETKGVTQPKSYLIPNWTDIEKIYPISRPNIFRDKLNYLEDDIILLYSGSLGEKQGIEGIINSAHKLQNNTKIKFIICGDGPAKVRLYELAQNLDNIKFLPLQPYNLFNELLNSADIHLLPQKSDAADLVMPSKLTGMLASGKPIIATAHKGTQMFKVLQTCGVCVEPENEILLTEAIINLANNKKKRKELGLHARIYAEKYLNKACIIDRFESAIK